MGIRLGGYHPGVFLLGVLVILVALFVVVPVIGIAIGWLIGAVITGLILGALARLILPGKQAISMVATIACGIAGSLVGGVIGEHIGVHWFGTLILEIIVSIIGVLIAERRQHRVNA